MSSAEDDAAVARVVEAVADDERRRGDALERPVIGAARLELRVRVLPEELAGGLAERHQHAAIAGLLRIAQQLVVRADEDHAARDDRVAVALRAELGHPLDVLLGLHVPVGGQALHGRHHVAVGRAAPHRPVAGARIGGREMRRRMRAAPPRACGIDRRSVLSHRRVHEDRLAPNAGPSDPASLLPVAGRCAVAAAGWFAVILKLSR